MNFHEPTINEGALDLFRKKKSNEFNSLISEIEDIKHELQQEEPTSRQISFQTKNPELQQLVDSINGLIDVMQTKYDKLHVKHQIDYRTEWNRNLGFRI